MGNKTEHHVKYYETHINDPPSPLLVKAMQFIPNPHKYQSALDLGCGQGTDTGYLTALGFQVTPVDKERAVIPYVARFGLTPLISPIEECDFPKQSYTLINSQFALPFIRPNVFSTTFTKIIRLIRKNGILVCNLFGNNDQWTNGNDDITFLRVNEVRELLREMKTVYLDEREYDAFDLSRKKHWHVFDVIA
ncbi:methyltransferase domain-containing protein, partial [Candidatus Roizmanbacteria bacterium]|nr:methyltransferase domain-containing protein [Candidatus Roizmanbacteria bacterium]